jgi:NTP pyrophosphatase (non-canonical NTP hydrolase)
MPTKHRIQIPAELRTALDVMKEQHAHIPYNDFVDGLCKAMPTVAEELHHATTGMSGEAGELLDITKKLWIYEKPVTQDVVEHMIEELGDLRWYYQAALNELGLTDEDIQAFNKRKLLKRYPGGVYTNQAAQARADKVPGADRKFFGKPDDVK